jgi:glycerophosphoryl diester phosphodiesterase
LSRDGQVVVTHEPRIEPGLCLDSDGTPLERPGPRVLDLELEQLQRFDCGLNPDPQRFPEPPRRNLSGSRIPTLVEVFELVQSRGDREVHFNLEVKVEPGSPDTPEAGKFVPLVLAVIERHGLLERCTLQSFDWKALRIAKALAPGLRTSALLAAPHTLGPAWQDGLALEDYGSVLRLLLAVRAYVDDFSPHWRHLVTGQDYLDASVADYQRAGFRVLPWTVNDVPTMERLIDLGVDGIISDRPDLLLEVTRTRDMRVR